MAETEDEGVRYWIVDIGYWRVRKESVDWEAESVGWLTSNKGCFQSCLHLLYLGATKEKTVGSYPEQTVQIRVYVIFN